MKFAEALAVLSFFTTSVHGGSVNQHTDRVHEIKSGSNNDFIGNSMWVFGNAGVSIYNPDGTNQFKTIPPKDICHLTAGYSGEDAESLSCSFYDVVSDGKKYVWAAVSRGVSKIDIMDIDTGSVVGSFKTNCNSPRQLEYHPLRDEIWVRCSAVDDHEAPSYIDVFSASSPSVDVQTEILIKNNSTFSSWGYSVIDSSLGDVGYTTDWNQPFLTKIDLSEKTVLDTFELPNAFGNYEVAYSKVNEHIFVRASVCCTCGFEGADLGLDCGRYGAENVTIQTGPFAGSVNISGTCGRCDGVMGVDTLGVYEFDTATDTIILNEHAKFESGNHVMKEGIGGDPFPSPDGEHIVLIANNGGTSIRILKTGEPGAKSTVYADLELGFDSTGFEEEAVFNDYAFIERGGRSKIIFASGTENKVAIVDITEGTPKVNTLVLKEGELTSERQRRQVEWSVGTDFVWVDGTAGDPHEIYVIDVMKEVFVRTITGTPTTKILSVNNYKRMEQMEMQHTFTSANAAYSGTIERESTTNVVGIVSLVLGILAIVVGVMNYVFLSKILAAKSSPVKMNEDVSLASIK